MFAIHLSTVAFNKQKNWWSAYH